MKKFKIFLVSLIVSLCLAAAVETVLWNNTPSTSQIIIPENAVHLYSEVEHYVYGYTIENNLYTPVDGDPQIGFPLSDATISTIIIEFNKIIDQDIPVDVYYASNGESLGEDKRLSTIFQKGIDKGIIQLESTQYSHIRLDINGSFELKEIYTSDTLVEPREIKAPPNFGRFLGIWIVSFVVCICSLFCYVSKIAKKKTENVDERKDTESIFAKIQKHRVAIFLVFIAAVFIEGVAWILSPAIHQVIIPDNAVNLYPGGQYYAAGYEITGNSYVLQGNDPQIGFPLDNLKVNTLIIEFDQPLEKDLSVTVFYARNQEALSEANKLSTVIRAGSNSAAINLEPENYSHIRIDIDASFTLKRICTSETPVELEEVPKPVNYSNVLLRCCVFLSIYVILRKVYSFKQLHQKTLFSRHMVFLNRCESFLSKNYVWMILVVMAGMILLQINNSSMYWYSTTIPNNIAETNTIIIGQPRAIRSDEYLVGTAMFFHDKNVGALSLLWENTDSIIVAISNVIKMINPYFWGELYLPASYAFSWKYVMELFVALIMFWRLLCIITKNKRFSAIGSFLLVFSPGLQWWGGPSNFGVLCGFVVLFYDFFRYREVWKKVLCCFGLICLTSIFISHLYPAWDIPLVYLYIFILIGIYATERKIDFRKTDIPYIGVTCVAMGVIIVAYFVSQGEATELMLSTVYPGKRFHSGGNLGDGAWFNYLVAPFTTWKPLSIIGANESEISSFLHLFPIPFLLFFLKFKDFKKNRVILSLVIFSLVCVVYMVFGIGDFLATVTFLRYSVPYRMFTIFGFASSLLLLFECYYIVSNAEWKNDRQNVVKLVLFNVVLVLSVIWVLTTRKDMIEYTGVVSFLYVVLCLIAMGNMLFLGAKKLFIISMCIVTLISGVVVHPINLGSDIMTDTQLGEAIQQIDEQDTGRWVALGSHILPKYVYAQGVDCLNWLSWPPRFDLFEPLDPEGEYRDLYNRYAHVILNLTTDETTFGWIQVDLFSLQLNVDDLKIWDVKYLVVSGGLPEDILDSDSVNFELIYQDELDQINIYQLSYT